MYSIDSTLALMDRHPGPMLALAAALPGLTAAIGFPLRKISPRGATIFATIPTHLAVLQGVSLCLVICYSAFILRKSLLSLNIVTHYLPVVSSGVTLALSSQVAPFEAQPGYGRLSGLCVMAALAFGVFFVLDRLHFFAGVFIPLASLGTLFLALNGAFRFAFKRLKGD